MEITKDVSKFVKPLTPTSSTLRKYTISFFDDTQPNINNNNNNHTQYNPTYSEAIDRVWGG
ncbi:hypothetical protein Hanom_Chr09g00767021 [Helianthus anomalus]